eukprot:GILK01004090.1.p1 GENE.GILK01004090.1~~GILK01004090.1.p1  ORF type:complete len:1295 (-),score=222.23 GILK01004090.1:130-3960(-)
MATGVAAGPRKVFIRELDRHAEFKYKTNEVVTSRYSALGFFPKNLFEQFQKVSNLYFLVLMGLQTWKAVSITNGTPTIALPLGIVILVTMFKDGLEDLRRHRSDHAENNRLQLIMKRAPSLHRKLGAARRATESDVEAGMNADCYELVAWKDVQVGDIVVCRNRDVFPADLVLLSTSDAHGLAFVETANLDGETNLKLRQAVADSQTRFKARESCLDLQGDVECEVPNRYLDTFDGKLTIQQGQEKHMVSLGPKQLLLRGCKLRNTEWVCGVAIYTGAESKIQMNSSRTPTKLSTLEKMTNKLTFIIFGFQLMLCAVAGVIGGSLENSSEVQSMWYLQLDSTAAAATGILRFFTFIIIFGNFIPISLIVTMGVVKSIQARFINMDLDMYHDGTDTFAQVRSSGLNEELGQVEYIFSDKTGTLTCNVMEFRKCCIAGVSYGLGLTEIRKGVLKKLGQPIPPDPVMPQDAPKTPNVNFIDPNLELAVKNRNHPQARCLREFFIHLAINHSVMPEYTESGQLIYSASSPDEGALVYGAKHFGFAFLDRDPSSVTVQIGNEKVKFNILHILEFTSERKRSSVLCEVEGRFVIYTKGADSIIDPRLSAKQEHKEQIYKAMEQFAVDGLRTLCIAYAEIPPDRYRAWAADYKNATLAVEDRARKVEAVADRIEQNLTLLGCTGIEDKLQAQVGDTIENLASAGIKLWMLTGDKVETAINIGHATSLLTTDMYRVTMTGEQEGTKQATMAKLKRFSNKINKRSEVAVDMESSLRRASSSSLFDSYPQQPDSKTPLKATSKEEYHHDGVATAQKSFALVIDGSCLKHALEPDAAQLFIDVATKCKSVICCRVSPEQKGSVVRLVRASLGKVTLAIGDGANDCNMIQAAHVGVGLRGEEGLQAFNSSDYGISQFRFLNKLLLVHGRWAYRRMSKLVLYMFYKNIVVCLPAYWLGIWSLFSGQKLYFEYMYQLYNIAFTAIPIMVLGVFDQDVGIEASLAHPELYRAGHKKSYFNAAIFVQWIVVGVWHSVVSFYVPYLTFPMITKSNGTSNDHWETGTVVYLLLNLIVSFKVALETCWFSWLTTAAIGASLFAWFMAMLLFSSVVSIAPDTLGVLQRLFSDGNFYFVIALGLVAALGRDLLYKGWKRSFSGQLYHVIQEQEAMRFKRARKEEFSKREMAQYYSERSMVLARPVLKPPRVNALNATTDNRGYAFSASDPFLVDQLPHSMQNDVRTANPLVRSRTTSAPINVAGIHSTEMVVGAVERSSRPSATVGLSRSRSSAGSK